MNNNENKLSGSTYIYLALIGHIEPEYLNKIQHELNAIDGLKIVFFKVSFNRLWVKEEISEGDAP